MGSEMGEGILAPKLQRGHMEVLEIPGVHKQMRKNREEMKT